MHITYSLSGHPERKHLFLIFDFECAEIEEMLDYCHRACSGRWRHSFSEHQRSFGMITFHTKEDAAKFKLCYGDFLTYPERLQYD
jgi:hypothetical protein